MDRDSENARKNPDVLAISGGPLLRFKKPLVDYLVSGLEAEDKWIRIFAADMLGNAGDQRAVAHLKPLLVDRDQDLRNISAHAVEMILSREEDPDQARPDACESCMIRLIAEDALRKNGSRDGNR